MSEEAGLDYAEEFSLVLNEICYGKWPSEDPTEKLKRVLDKLCQDTWTSEKETAVKTLFGKCAVGYGLLILLFKKDVRKEILHDPGFSSLACNYGLTKSDKAWREVIAPTIIRQGSSYSLNKLIGMMDMMSAAVPGLPIFRLQFGDNIQIDSPNRIDSFWTYVQNNDTRAREIILRQTLALHKQLFPQKDAGKKGLETPVPPKEEYTTKEVCKMLKIAPSTFCGYRSNIDGFPEPIDPKNIPHKYNREAVEQIRTLVQNHKNSLIKNIPTKIKQTKKTTKKHRRT